MRTDGCPILLGGSPWFSCPQQEEFCSGCCSPERLDDSIVDNRAGCPRHVRFTKSQHDPSYMAVMLNMADAADGILFTPLTLFHYFLYIRSVAVAVSASLRWHVS